MATLTLPTDTVLIDPDLNTYLTNVKTNVDALYTSTILGTANPVVVTDAASYAVLAANTDKIHVIPDLTATCTLTLPAAAAGLKFKFIYGGAAADAQDWNFVTTDGFYIGGVVWLQLAADDAEDEVAVVFSDGNSNDNFDVVTPSAGTWVEFFCNGTNWYINGMVVSATTPTMADS